MDKLKNIVEMLRVDDNTQEIIKDANLISAVAFYDENENLSRWEIILHDVKRGKTYKVDVFDNNAFELYESELLDKEFENAYLDLSAVKIDEDEALRIAQQHFMEHYKNKEVNGIILALDVINQTWNVNLLTPYFSVIQIVVDLFDGAIKDSKEVQLVHEQ